MRWKMMRNYSRLKKTEEIWQLNQDSGFWIGKKLETGKTEYGFMLNKILHQ